MEDEELLSAAKARELFECNKAPILEVINEIKNNAKRGCTQSFLHDRLYPDDEAKIALIKLGYTVKDTKGPMGEPVCLISW